MKTLLLIAAMNAGCATTHGKVLTGVSVGFVGSGDVLILDGRPAAGGVLLAAGLFAAVAALYTEAGEGLSTSNGGVRVAAGSYKKVSIFNGQADCGSGIWAQERAVIRDSDGYYKACDVFNGQCTAPGTWYQGDAVIHDSDGYYKSCDVFNGRCAAPGSWYQGTAVVWCDE